MVEFCRYDGWKLYKIEGEYIKDFYGRFLYIIDGNYLRKWDSREIIFQFDGLNIKNFYSQILYKFDGEWLRDLSGQMLYSYKNGNIAPFGGLNKYKIVGYPTKKEIAFLMMLFVINN